LTERNVQLLICKPAIWREEFADPALPGWAKTWGASVECDGDIVKFTKGPTNDFYVLFRLGLNIDTDDYPYVVFRAKKTSNLVGVTSTWVEIYASEEWIGGYEFTETDFTIHAFQLPAGNTVTEVRLTFGNAGTIVGSMYVDFILFTKANPFYSTEDLDDVFDIPQYRGGVNDRVDFLQLIIDNHNGQHKDRFAYRDEAYLWVKKNGSFERIFGGYIDNIDPERVQYGREYLTLNALGWSALLYERFIAEAYEDEDIDDVVKDILDEAENQAALGFTTFGVKDVQKKMTALKCDYDVALSKIVEMVEEYDLCFNIEPNRDASLYPLGKRFLRYAGWMEDSWEKGWGCSAHQFETDGDIAQMKTAVAGGAGTLYRVTLISVDSTIFKKLLLELKGPDADTQYSVKLVTEDDVEYTVQALTAAPTSYTVLEWDLTSIITGANKVVKNVKLGISKSGSQGILYFKWLGFFSATPPYEKITLDAATNVHAGAFLRDPKKVRNMVIVKGDKFEYNFPDPLDSDAVTENNIATDWTVNDGSISADVDAKKGKYSVKATLSTGTSTNFQRLSSGLIKYEEFPSDPPDPAYWSEGSAGNGVGDTYITAGELYSKTKSGTGSEHSRFVVEKNVRDIYNAKLVVELKLMRESLGSSHPGDSCGFIFCPIKTTTQDPHAIADVLALWPFKDYSVGMTWYMNEKILGQTFHDHWSQHFDTDNETKVAKLLFNGNTVKLYLDNDPKVEFTRITSFQSAYIYLRGATDDTVNFHYQKFDNLKVYKDIKVFVAALHPGWKVELWSGTGGSPGSKVAEAYVPADSTIAELDVLTLSFPFTGFFKIYNDQGGLDDTSPDYSDIWGGDVYQAKQSTQVQHLIVYPQSKDWNVNALALSKLRFWYKHSDPTATAKLILATDDNNYYYIEFSPSTKWDTEFEFNVGFTQNIEFQEVGSPQLKNINYVGFLYPSDSPVTWCRIDELRFIGETEAWGIATDEDKIAEYGLQPEKIFTSYYKTQQDAQKAAGYFLSILKQPPLVKGSLTHPWGLPQIRAGEIAIVNVPNQNINSEEMIIQEVAHTIPPASTKFTTEINLAGVPHALTDPQKRLKEHIERLQKADVYAENVEVLIGPVKDRMTVTDYMQVLFEFLLQDNLTISDLLQAIIDALLTDSMSIVDYLQARWIWDDFNTLDSNIWSVETGTWSADGVLHQTQTTTGAKRLKFTKGHLVNYTWETKVKLVTNYDQSAGNLFRRVDANNTYEVTLIYYVSGNKGVQYYKCVGGTWTQLAFVAKTITTGTFYKLKTDQRNEGTGIRTKVWFEAETNPCINHLQDPRSHNDGDFLMYNGILVAGAKADFDYCYMWTE